jgi:hypothetical protein
MPISKYFGGHGKEVQAQMKRKYGADWERHFYAIANAKKQTPKSIATKGKKK